jgi:hypothetical protein
MSASYHILALRQPMFADKIKSLSQVGGTECRGREVAPHDRITQHIHIALCPVEPFKTLFAGHLLPEDNGRLQGAN